MKKTKLYLNHACYCEANEKEAIKGGRKLKIKFVIKDKKIYSYF